MRLEKIQSQFWDYQTTVSEEGIIAKILRAVEKGPSMKIDLLTDDEHDTLNTYESIGFFKSAVYQRIGIAMGFVDPGDPDATPSRHLPASGASPTGGEIRVVTTRPSADIAWHKVGQAQLWYSTMSKVCVLWECLAFGGMKTRVGEFWDWILRYCEFLGMEKIYTHDRDPAYDEDYREFLESLGFELVREGTMKKRIMRTDVKHQRGGRAD